MLNDPQVQKTTKLGSLLSDKLEIYKLEIKIHYFQATNVSYIF